MERYSDSDDLDLEMYGASLYMLKRPQMCFSYAMEWASSRHELEEWIEKEEIRNAFLELLPTAKDYMSLTYKEKLAFRVNGNNFRRIGQIMGLDKCPA